MDNQSVLSKDDSYTERRKLFKNIWDTAIHMDVKEPESGTKPKVINDKKGSRLSKITHESRDSKSSSFFIKTLRLGENNGINIGKSKKQRIKNLRTVCTRLLDFCDRQDAADLLYEKDRRQDKIKTSLDFEVTDGSVTHRGTKPHRDMQSPRIERATLIEQFLNERLNLEKSPPVPAEPSSELKLQVGDALCKVVKKKHRKRKKVAPIPSALPRVTSAHMKRVHTRTSERKKST